VKTRIFRNLGWKIVGLVLSFALWFHLTTKQQFNQKALIEIEYKNVPAGLRLTPESLKNVSVDITANGRALFEILYFNDLKLVIDLRDFKKPGKYSVELNRDQLTIPPNLDDVRIGFLGLRNCEFELAGIDSPNADSRH
jgi:hypothetical protein